MRSIFEATIDFDDRIDWEAIRDQRVMPAFKFDEPPPEKPRMPPPLSPPPSNLLERLLPFFEQRRQRRIEAQVARREARISALENTWRHSFNEWAERREVAGREHSAEAERLAAECEANNREIEDLRQRFEAADPSAIEQYLDLVFSRSEYPGCFDVVREVASVDLATGIVLIDLHVPSKEDLDDVLEYRFVKSTGEMKAKTMSSGAHNQLYDSAAFQSVIRTLHEVCESVYIPHIKTVAVNMWVEPADLATGRPGIDCICSVMADREQVEGLNLGGLEPAACLESLNARFVTSRMKRKAVEPLVRAPRAHLQRDS